MKAVSILLGLALLFGCSRVPDSVTAKSLGEPQKEDQYRKELDEIRKTMKGEVKIKLKKDGKGDFYSWEISGKDANEVLRANDTLAKKLGQ